MFAKIRENSIAVDLYPRRRILYTLVSRETGRILIERRRIKMCSMRDNNVRESIAGEFIDRRRSICNGEQHRCLLSLADFHSRGVPHVRVRAVTAGITMHDVTLGSNPPYLLRATMLQESETLANQVTPTSYSRR